MGLPSRRRLKSLYLEFYYTVKGNMDRVVGVDPLAHNPPVTVSLTSIYSRLHLTYLTIETLLRQTVKPSRIVLWIPTDGRGAPPVGYEASLTVPLQRMRHRGLDIRWTRDMGPHTKLIPSLIHYPDNIVVTADDDTFYPPTWLEQLLAGHRKHPQAVVCHRGLHVKLDPKGALLPYDAWPEYGAPDPGNALLPLGRDGVLYPPGCFTDEVFNESVYRKTAPINDDIWFKAMSLRAGRQSYKLKPQHKPFLGIYRTQEVDSLKSRNVDRGRNDPQMRETFEHYGLLGSLEA